MLRINSNPSALQAAFRADAHHDQAERSRKKLASGLKVSSAADDAAILSISQRFNARATGAYQASDNALAGISLLQTAEGAMGQSQGVLQRMRELSLQGANGTLNASDRQSIQAEMDQLSEQLDAIADQTTFNDRKLLDGTLSGSGLSLQVGPNAGNTSRVSLSSVKASDLGLAGVSAATPQDATSALSSIDQAMARLSSSRSQVGARINGLQATVSGLGTSALNAEAANSRMVDLDMALELTKLASSQILGQSALAMQSQANASSASALRLLT